METKARTDLDRHSQVPSARMPQSLLSLRAAAMSPGALTSMIALPWGGQGVFRPLGSGDWARLRRFYEGLSAETRRFYSVPDDVDSLAAAHCGEIACHDKLRLVFVEGDAVIGLIEFSFDLVRADIARYQTYGIRLHAETDCRFGLCVASALQGRGLGQAILAPSLAVAARFGRERVILWGGVHAANARAVRYYRRSGFIEAGRFLNDDGVRCIDMIATI